MRINKKLVQFKASHWADIRRRLAARGGRLTPQRMAIYDAVVGRTTHPSVSAVHEEVRQRFPGLSRATVYSTLEFFARLGLVQEVSGPVRRYDGRPDLHINLVCSRCGQVSDVADAELEPLRRRAVGRMGFHVESVRFELHGVCNRCGARRHVGRTDGTRGGTRGKR
jgi:Fur family peroxide stress response transcriptional regulator